MDTIRLVLWMLTVSLLVNDGDSVRTRSIVMVGQQAAQQASSILWRQEARIPDVLRWNSLTSALQKTTWDPNKKVFEPVEGKVPSFQGTNSEVQLVMDNRSPPSEVVGMVHNWPVDGDSLGRLSIRAPGVTQDYVKEVLTALRENGLQSEVSGQDVIKGTDSTGRAVYGRMEPGGPIQWGLPEGSRGVEYVAKSGPDGGVTTETNRISSGAAYVRPLGVKSYPLGDKASQSILGFEDLSTNIIRYYDNDGVFRALTEGTQSIFDPVVVPADWGSRGTRRIVRFKDGNTKTVEVREFSNPNDLLTEIKYWGSRGFKYPRPKGTIVTPNGEQTNKYVYLRYGDWVLTMKVESSTNDQWGINPFYINLEGVIHAEDPNMPGITKNEHVKVPDIISHAYKDIQPHTDDLFFRNVIDFYTGVQTPIPRDSLASAYNAEVGSAMFVAEPIRDWRTFPTNRMALDRFLHGDLDRNEFFETAPMARGGTGPARYSGLRDTSKDKRFTEGFEVTKYLFVRSMYDWYSGYNNDNSRGLLKKNEGTILTEADQLDIFTESMRHLLVTSPDERSSLYQPPLPPDGCLKRAAGKCSISDDLSEPPWDARQVESPEIDTTQTQFDTFTESEEHSLSLQTSMALLTDQITISKDIARTIREREETTGKSYQVDQDSIRVENGKLTFDLIDVEDPTETESVEDEFDDSKLATKQILDETETKVMGISNEHEGGVSHSVGRVLGIYGTIFGLQATLNSFEEGDNTDGAIDLAMTLHGIGELSGVNRLVYRAAGRVLGAVMRGSVKRIASVTESIVGEDAASAVLSGGDELLSAGTRVGELAEDIPFVGTAFGIYNIYEDLKQGTPIGYVDAGLDSLITVLGVLGPEAEPVTIALTVIRMTIGTFYYDIKHQIDSLPPGASTGEKILAVVKGIWYSLGDIADTVTGGIFTFSDKSQKLDEQFDNNQAFLQQLSDYNNYFSVVKESGSGSTAINFAGGKESWNGGDIVFVLKDDGLGDLTMTTTNTDGQEVDTYVENIAFGPNANDIIMGIGESHTVNFRTERVKVLWFIPVDTKRIISGLNDDSSTLQGSYTGNSRSNNFFSVQELPSDSGLKYNLEDYFYHLIGGDGDDMFYLGPQHALVEGGLGEDVYFVNVTTTWATLNNLALDQKNDYVIIQHNYNELNLIRSGADVIITTDGADSSVAPKQVTLQNWYSSSAYQHLTIRTEDGVLFRITIDELGQAYSLPFTLTAAGSPVGRKLNANLTGLETVRFLVGSAHDDTLVGNSGTNTLIGGAGNDVLTGGPGKDTYNLEKDSGCDTIINYAEDKQQDSLLIPAQFADITARRLAMDLVLSTPTLDIVLLYWFEGEEHQHCVFISEDYIIFEVKSIDIRTIHFLFFESIQPSREELSTIPIILELAKPSSVDLTSSSVLRRVPTVIGSNGDDNITANNKNNYLMGGSGDDFIKGGEGSDVYVIHPNQGHDQIYNLAADQQQDLLLFGTTYNDAEILPNFDGDHLRLVSSKDMSVTILNWFTLNTYQHLTVRSVDGVEFTLPTNKTTLKTPIVIDRSSSNQSQVLDLNRGELSTVQRVIGSQADDCIAGNHLSNYIDPSLGDIAELRGNNGSDTYVVKPGYGQVTVYNKAEDGLTDSVLFLFPLHSITVSGSGPSLVLATVDVRNGASVTLFDYISSNNSRHLTVTTSDGFTFVLPPSNNFQPLPIVMNRYKDNTGQFINLTRDSLHSVVTVYGAQRYRNYIYGNSFNNTLVGGDVNDCIDGGEGDDVIKGGKGTDRITGGEGQDTLVGEGGDDTLDGGPGNDILVPGPGSNTVIGGDGVDTVLYDGDPFNSTGVTVDLYNGLGHHPTGLDSLEGVENVYGTPFADIMISSSLDDNVLSGRGGDDHLIAYSAYNILIGGEGQDKYNLTYAQGTKVIDNFARDLQLDSVYMSFVDSGDLRYQITGYDLIIRKVSDQYRSPLLPKNVCNASSRASNSLSSHSSNFVPGGGSQSLLDIYPTDDDGNPVNRYVNNAIRLLYFVLYNILQLNCALFVNFATIFDLVCIQPDTIVVFMYIVILCLCIYLAPQTHIPLLGSVRLTTPSSQQYC